MTSPTVRIIIFVVLIGFVIGSCILKRPVTREGKLSLRLTLANVLSWLIVLPLNEGGHPPLWLIIGSFLYLINFPLLIATAAVLWKTFRENEERRGYITIASIYVVLNMLALYVIPALALIVSSPILTS